MSREIDATLTRGGELRRRRESTTRRLSVDALEEAFHGRDVLGRAAEEDVGGAALDDDVLVREACSHEVEGRRDVALARVVREALGGGRRLDRPSLLVEDRAKLPSPFAKRLHP